MHRKILLKNPRKESNIGHRKLFLKSTPGKLYEYLKIPLKNSSLLGAMSTSELLLKNTSRGRQISLRLKLNNPQLRGYNIHI